MYIKYNDFELLYLIDDGSEEAYFAMIEKYSYYIRKKISDFHIKSRYSDDYFQEGLMVLDRAIRLFDEYKGKSFTMYFDMLLVYKFQRLLSLEKNYFFNVSLVEFPEMLEDSVTQYDTIDMSFALEDDLENLGFSKLEKEIYLYVLRGFKPREIASRTNTDIKIVYNAICRSKMRIEKLKK